MCKKWTLTAFGQKSLFCELDSLLSLRPFPVPARKELYQKPRLHRHYSGPPETRAAKFCEIPCIFPCYQGIGGGRPVRSTLDRQPASPVSPGRFRFAETPPMLRDVDQGVTASPDRIFHRSSSSEYSFGPSRFAALPCRRRCSSACTRYRGPPRPDTNTNGDLRHRCLSSESELCWGLGTRRLGTRSLASVSPRRSLLSFDHLPGLFSRDYGTVVANVQAAGRKIDEENIISSPAASLPPSRQKVRVNRYSDTTISL